MARKVAVINVVGLSGSLLPHAPRIAALGSVTRLRPVLPAVTCSVQASMLTGLPVGGPGGHGIVGNGWFNHEQQEVQFWKQSNKLVMGEKVWETARKRDPSVTCANLFWWFNMYSSVDYSVTPRPQYRADGRKVPDCYTHPAELRDALQRELGPFPLFHFWGPLSDIRSSQWIADATRLTVERHDPTLTLVYLPHLDYCLQKLGPQHPDIPREVAAIDAVAGGLIDFFRGRDTRVLVVSEYGIEATAPSTSRGAAGAAISINRHLREAGLLAVRDEGGRELLDAGASRAFAVADHQVAHVYVGEGGMGGGDAEPHGREAMGVEGMMGEAMGVKGLLEGIAGVARVERIDHPRAGRWVVVARPGHWFCYDYWPADRPERSPDFARTVDIHRKPGYDPRELFMGASKPALVWKLLRKKLGFRQVMDVIPLDASLVKGTHGRVDVPDELMPVLIGADGTGDEQPCTAVRDVILQMMFGGAAQPVAATR